MRVLYLEWTRSIFFKVVFIINKIGENYVGDVYFIEQKTT
jgi:hypothetical protein